MPKYLAGRKRERAAIRSALAILKVPRDSKGFLSEQPEAPIILVGPRGVGKTVLLRYAERQAQELGIASVLINKVLLEKNPSALVQEIAAQSTWAKTVKILKGAGVSLSVKEIELQVAFAPERLPMCLHAALKKRLQQEPLLLVLDEVHTYDKNYLQQVFIIIQDLISTNHPLAVIMAGTPGLMRLIHSCGASFVERSEVMRMNILNLDETQAALLEPAKQSGIPLTSDALKLLTTNSDCYPFFIQMLGKQAWGIALEEGHEEITLTDAQQGLEIALQDRRRFYSERYAELMQSQLLDYANHTIRWMQEAQGILLASKLLDNLVQECKIDFAQALAIYNELSDLGFIWEKENILEPGILSLFSYVEEKRTQDIDCLMLQKL